MPKQSITQTFEKGTTPERSRGNFKSEQYKYGFEESLNVIVTPGGGLMRRPGTVNFYSIPSIARIIPYQKTFNTGRVVIIFGSDADEIPDTVLILDKRADIVGTATHALGTTATIYEMDWLQIRNSILFASGSWAPQILSETAEDTYANITAFDLEDGPWETPNAFKKFKIRVLNGTLTDGEVTGTVNLKARNKKGNSLAWFDDNWVTQKRSFRIRQKNSDSEIQYGIVKLATVATTKEDFTGAVQSSSVIPDNHYPLVDNTAGNVSANWSLNSFYTGNYPTRLGVFGNRLWFARDNWRFASVSGDFNRFSPNIPGLNDTDEWVVTAASAITVQTTALKTSKPSWILGLDNLIIATDQGLEAIAGGTSGITPSDISYKPQSGIGVSPIKPIVGENIYYVDITERNIYQTSYDVFKARYTQTNITEDHHLFRSGIRAMAKLSYPWTMLWVVLKDGRVVCGTADKTEKEFAWALQDFGTNIIDICAARLSADTQETLFFVSAESFGESVTSSILKLGSFNVTQGEGFSYVDLAGNSGELEEEEYLTDGATLHGAGSYNTNSLDSAVLVDRDTYTNYVDNQGTVTIPNRFEVGRPIEVYVKLNPLDAADTLNDTRGFDKKTQALNFNLNRSLAFKFKDVDDSHWDEVNNRRGSDIIGQAPDIFSGDLEIDFSSDEKRILQIEITQDEQVPFCLNSISYRAEINDE
jgi:hypothetical protein